MEAPTPADAGDDQLNIAGTTTYLDGNEPVSGSGLWTVTSGTGGIIDDPDDNNSLFSGIAGNLYTLKWQISTPCDYTFDSVTISFSEDGGGDFSCGDTLIDSRDGQTYKTVLIDTLCWMAENLNIGIVIDNGIDQTNNDTIEKYCSYNGIADSCDVFGGMYQWVELMPYVTDTATQGICPGGWHVPTHNEWKILEGTVDSLYGVGDPVWDIVGWRGYDAGKNLKSISGWASGGNGTDAYGFSALPAGRRMADGSFGSVQSMTYIWISEENGTSEGWSRYIRSDLDNIRHGYFSKTDGRSVRCIKNH